jgi:AcrR family transcriptional regulator
MRYSHLDSHMTAIPNPPSRQYHKGNVAEDLKAVASHILETERVEDLSVRRLTREVGVTPANFYNHFASLNDMLLEIAAEHFLERTRNLAHIRRTSKTRAEAVRRVATSYVDLASTRYQLFRIMFGLIPDALQHDRFRAASDATFGELVHLVYGQPMFDPLDLDASRERCKVAYGLMALGYGLARVVVEGQVPFSSEKRAEMRRFVESVVDAFIGGELTSLVS